MLRLAVKSRATLVLVTMLSVMLSRCAAQDGVTVVNIIPRGLSAETNQDSEPFLSVSSANQGVLVVSAFTPDLNSGTSAPIFVSTDGGATWFLNSIVPSARSTADISHTFGGSTLYAAILALPMESDLTHMKELDSADVIGGALMRVLSSRDNTDQPFLVSKDVSGSPKVLLGVNDFNSPRSGRTATVDVLDGAAFRSVHVESRATIGQDGPSVRPTIAKDGTAYAAYFGWRGRNGFLITSDVVVVRDDPGAHPGTFQSLVDDEDQQVGKRVAKETTIPWLNEAALGPERIGSTLAIAVDPNNSSQVYVAWGDRIDNDAVYTIHLRSSSNKGVTWSQDLRTIKNASSISLAVSDTGVAGFLYQQLTTENGHSRWVTILEQSRDAFSSQPASTTLADVSAELDQPNLPYNGDYNSLLAVGDHFQGVFAANNEPVRSNFPVAPKYQRMVDWDRKILLDENGHTVGPSIDPFFFSVPVLH